MTVPVPATREEAWGLYVADVSLGYVELHPAVAFDAGFDAGLRRAAEVAAPDYSKGTPMRRENYVRDDIRAAILAECSEGSE